MGVILEEALQVGEGWLLVAEIEGFYIYILSKEV